MTEKLHMIHLSNQLVSLWHNANRWECKCHDQFSL